MVVLCRELLISDTESLASADLPIDPFQSLNQAVNAEFVRGRPIHLLDEVIECLRDAVKVCLPDSYDVLTRLYALANQLCTRFIRTHSNVDYEDATGILERMLDPNQPGECPDSIRQLASGLATALAHTGSIVFKDPESSEVAISRLRTELSSPSIDEGLRLHITECLEFQTRERFTQYSLAENLEEANSYTSQAIGLSSSSSLAKSGELFSSSEGVRETYSATAIQQQIQYHE
jgi:hypothetical protein